MNTTRHTGRTRIRATKLHGFNRQRTEASYRDADGLDWEAVKTRCGWFLTGNYTMTQTTEHQPRRERTMKKTPRPNRDILEKLKASELTAEFVKEERGSRYFRLLHEGQEIAVLTHGHLRTFIKGWNAGRKSLVW